MGAIRDSGCTCGRRRDLSCEWSFPLLGAAGYRQAPQRLNAGQEKIRAASHRREGGQAGDLLADRALRDFVFQSAVMMADERIAFVAEFVKIPIVHPDILGKLEL